LEELSFNDWFGTFLEEKGLSTTEIELENRECFTLIPIGVIKEALSNCSKEYQSEVKVVLTESSKNEVEISAILEYLAKRIIYFDFEHEV